MSTTVDSGNSPDISQLIKEYQRNPSENRQKKDKAFKAIETQIDQLSKETLALQGELDRGYESVLRGGDGLTSRRIDEIQGKIKAKQEHLSDLKCQLANLAKYKKSQKLASRILLVNISLGELDGRAETIKEIVTNNIHTANKCVSEINAILKEANKKTSRKDSGTLMLQAVEKYAKLEQIKNSLPKESDEHRLLDTQMTALKVKMTKVAGKQLPLSKSEIIFYNNYSDRSSLSPAKTKKLIALDMRIAVASRYFPSIASQNVKRSVNRFDQATIQKFEALKIGSLEKNYPEADEAFYDDSLSFQTPISRENELTSRLTKHRLSKQEKMRTKVRATPYQLISEGDVVEIANAVHAKAKTLMRAQVEFKGIQKKYQTGSYDKVALERDLREVEQLIQNTEKELAQLQSEVASKGTSKLVEKVENAIGNTFGIVRDLKVKKQQLELIVQKQYEESSKALNVVQNNVVAAMHKPKEAGFLIFEAYEALERLQILEVQSIPTINSTEEEVLVAQQIQEMKKVAEALLSSAKCRAF